MLDYEKDKHMKQLKRKIECWREALLILNSILTWEKSWYPGLIVGSTTTIFLFIWILEPALLTVVSSTLLLLALADYFAVVIFPTFSSFNSWTGQKERKFEEICTKLSAVLFQIQSIWESIVSTRNNRPTFYYGSITLCLSLLAWLGSIINNLFLIYLTVNAILLTPGFRHNDIVQSAMNFGSDELNIDEFPSINDIKYKSS